MEPDLYQVLQVDPAADPQVVDTAFRRLARKYHPDFNSSPDATRAMQQLTAAYDVLRDPGRRAAYDRDLAARRRPKPPARRQSRGGRSNGPRHEEGVEVSLLGGLARLGIRWTRPSR